ncbi:MAG: methyl-accepting chemotaxis protein, partial [Candidatus Heimdallarchaeota archaeon]|nr:methyl-accepting chemotaxis protein [Candidatus Heimdallarchaeota archaeon]
MARISIRNRLLLISVLLLLTFGFQTTLVKLTNESLDALEDRGQQYINRDNQVLADLLNLEVSAERLVRTQLDNYYETIFNYNAEPSGAERDNYLATLDEVKATLNQRLIERYKFGDVEISSLVMLTKEETQILSDEGLNRIIDVEFGVINEVYQLDGFLRSELATFVLEADKSKENFVGNSSLYYDINLETHELFEGMIHLQHHLFNGLQTANETYFKNVTLSFTDIFAFFQHYAVAYSHLESDYITLNTGDINLNFTDSVDNFIEEIDQVEGNISLILDLIKPINLDLQEQEVLTNIYEIFSNNATNLKDNMDNSIEILTELKLSLDALDDLRKGTLTDFTSLVDVRIGEAKFLLLDELSRFETQFNDLKNSIRERVQVRDQWLAIGLAIIVSAIAVLTAITLRITLSRLSKKQTQVSLGNIDVVMRKRYPNDEIGDVERGFDEMATSLKSIITGVLDTSYRLAGISEMLAAGTQEASASITDVSNTVQEISDGATRQNMQINQINEKLIDHQAQIRRASVEIANASFFVVKVAQRTNTLGLNAAIEAAKAKEYGKGFGIVADQVRLLSNDAKKSANSISEQVEEINT